MKWTVVRVFALIMALWCLSSRAANAQVPLVPIGSEWRYLDTGTDEGTAWRASSHDDSGWLSGPAQLGFGDGDEATTISRTNAAGMTNITFYFRHAFDVASPGDFTNLLVRLQRDDGAIVYLNGTEIFRSNLPNEPVDYLTVAFLAQDDGTAFFARPVDRALLVSGRNVLAVELHQNTNTSSDITFDLELVGNVTFQPPVIAITGPTNGAVIGSLNLLITTQSSDNDGGVAFVDFFVNDALVGVSAEAPYSFIESYIAVGTYTLRAVAVDTTGLSATSAPVVITVPPRLVPSGAAWRYFDFGPEPGAAWFTIGYDDSGWSNGIAQLGFGDGDEATGLSRTNTAGMTNIAFYFRHSFNVPNPGAVSDLALRVIRDDGAIVYLNDTEVFRINMPTGTVTSATFSAQVVNNDGVFHSTRIPAGLLRSGANLLAVQVHQFNLTSSDISFDLELLPNAPFTPPSIAIVSPTNGSTFFGPTNLPIHVLAADADDQIASVSFFMDGSPLGVDATDAYDTDGRNYSLVVTNIGAGSFTFRAIATDASGRTATSAPVQVSIALAPSITSLIATGAVWKYLDTGIDQGTNWRTRSFDDTTWPSGPAKLGTNDSPVTVIKIRNATGNQVNTAYFRHAFPVADATRLTNLAFRVLRDDGCIAYLNGTEIFRMNMPTGTVTFNTAVANAVGGNDEFAYFPTNIAPGLLINGTNLLAVELHQSLSTSDAGFDLLLIGVGVPLPGVPALSIQRVSSRTVLSWPGTDVILQESSRPEGPYTNRPTATSPFTNQPPSGNRFFRLMRP